MRRSEFSHDTVETVAAVWIDALTVVFEYGLTCITKSARFSLNMERSCMGTVLVDRRGV